MESFFEWMGTLKQEEIIRYAIVVVIVMVLIPYTDLLVKIWRKIIFREKLTIQKFGFRYYPYQEGEKDERNINFVLEGGKVQLYWEIKGALSVRIYPKVGQVNGNSAEVIVSKHMNEFRIEARSFFSKQIADIVIPAEAIKSLHTVHLSDTIVRTELQKVKATPFSEVHTLNTKITQSKINQFRFTSQMPETKHLEYKLKSSMEPHREYRDFIILKQACLKQHTFSTLKYNNVYPLKPFIWQFNKLKNNTL